MDPPFERMRDHLGAVEMKTDKTRTFGFFAAERVFVGLRLDLSENTHNDKSLYDVHGAAVTKFLEHMTFKEKDLTTGVEQLIGSGKNND